MTMARSARNGPDQIIQAQWLTKQTKCIIKYSISKYRHLGFIAAFLRLYLPLQISHQQWLNSSKKNGKGKRPGKGGNRFWKSVGLGFKTPREAIEGTYIDKKCPFTGDVSIRGRILAGTCHSAKMVRTIIVRRDYLHYVKKYEKRHSNIPAHISPCFRVKEGDHVTIGQCRPLSKTVRFNVLKVIPAGSSGGGKKAFTGI
ncbi:hypothetical protein R6Q57_006951 [Mikania cordata]